MQMHIMENLARHLKGNLDLASKNKSLLRVTLEMETPWWPGLKKETLTGKREEVQSPNL
jgi:hypothetical protein